MEKHSVCSYFNSKGFCLSCLRHRPTMFVAVPWALGNLLMSACWWILAEDRSETKFSSLRVLHRGPLVAVALNPPPRSVASYVPETISLMMYDCICTGRKPGFRCLSQHWRKYISKRITHYSYLHSCEEETSPGSTLSLSGFLCSSFAFMWRDCAARSFCVPDLSMKPPYAIPVKKDHSHDKLPKPLQPLYDLRLRQIFAQVMSSTGKYWKEILIVRTDLTRPTDRPSYMFHGIIRRIESKIASTSFLSYIFDENKPFSETWIIYMLSEHHRHPRSITYRY